MRIIKNLEKLSSKQLSVDDSRAVTDFRAFATVADLHASRVSDPDAIIVMLEVVDGLRDILVARNSNLQCP